MESEKELKEGKSSTKDSRFIKFVPHKISCLQHNLQTYGMRETTNIYYLQCLFLFYGPELFYAIKWFIENKENEGSKEYVNVNLFFFSAALSASSHWDDEDYNKV